MWCDAMLDRYTVRHCNQFSVEVCYSNHIALRIHALPLMIPQLSISLLCAVFIHRASSARKAAKRSFTASQSQPVNLDLSSRTQFQRTEYLDVVILSSPSGNNPDTNFKAHDLLHPDKRSFASVKVPDSPLIGFAAVLCLVIRSLCKGKVWCRAEGFLCECGRARFS